MPDPQSFEETLRALDDTVADLSRRVAALEQAASRSPVAPEPTLFEALTSPAAPTFTPAAPDVVRVLTFVGRTLIVFGGAYLLRALTESGRVPAEAGIALGLIYAAAWYGVADRAAGLGRQLSSVFHGTTAVLIGLPLIWEAVTRFHVLDSQTSALAILVFIGLALAVAWRRRLAALAGVASIAGLMTVLALSSVTGHVLPFAAALVVIGIGTLWQGEILDWKWLRWPAALAADLVLLVLSVRSTVDPPAERPDAAALVLLAFFVAYAGSLTLWLLGRGRRARYFEFVQVAAALMIGLYGATAIARAHLPALVWVFGAFGAACAAAAYIAAFSLARQEGTSRGNFQFFAVAALGFVLVGSATLAAGDRLALALALLAVAASVLASRFGEPMALLHGAVLSVGAVVASGLMFVAGTVWLTSVSAWPSLSVAAWVTLAVIAADAVMPSAPSRPGEAVLDLIARALLAALLAAGACTAVVLLVGPRVAGTPADAGVLASVKTVVASAGAMLLARASRFPRARAAGWLAYPILAFGALKLFLEDFRESQPSTLFFALAVYGAALIAVPRLMRGSGPAWREPGLTP